MALVSCVLGLGLLLAWPVDQAFAQAPRQSRQAPKVRSKAAVPRAPEDYAADYEDATAPPGERASFFGLPARGKVFAFVVDCSGSMAGTRLLRAKAELRKSLSQLRHPQGYFVVFYNDEPRIMPGGIPRAADLATFDRVDHWLRRIDAEGPTDPRQAMALALAMKPDAVFLLSDGEYPTGTVEAIADRNPAGVPIHCVALGGGAGADSLRKIAAESGGRFASR